MAFIDEELCIGCTLCIQACPVDAILGAAKQMHTVIASECTGCELCLEPCPVDCIDMLPLDGHTRTPGADQTGRRHVGCHRCVAEPGERLSDGAGPQAVILQYVQKKVILML